jgi:MFS family permease
VAGGLTAKNCVRLPKREVERGVKRVLGITAYRRLLCAYALNVFAWNLGAVALTILVYRRTGSAVGTAAFFVSAQFVPAFFSPFLVARLQRHAQRRVLPTLYALQALTYLVLASLVSRFSLAPMLSLVFVDGVVALTAASLLRASTVAVLKPKGLLREGNAVMNGAFSVAFMISPAVAGIASAAGYSAAALVANGCIFGAAALTIATTSRLPTADEAEASEPGRLRAALAYVTQHAEIRVLLGLQASALAFFAMSMPVEVLLAQHTLHAGAEGYGVMASGWGIGAVVGSAAYARWQGLSSRTLLALSTAMLAFGFGLMAGAPSVMIAALGCVLSGVGNGIEVVAARTALQEHAEQSWMPLVMSFNESISQAAPGVGIVLGGSIAAVGGPRLALATASLGALVVAAGVLIVLQAPAPTVAPTPELA